MSDNEEKCAVDFCGFVWDAVGAEQIGPRLIAASRQTGDLLVAHDQDSLVRTKPEIWSPVEYASHVRDVLLNLRDRLIVAINEDNPSCKAIYSGPRIDQGFYAGDSANLVANELFFAAELFARTWEKIPTSLHSRTTVMAWPKLADRSIHWVAAQALHEVEHHLEDVRRLVLGVTS